MGDFGLTKKKKDLSGEIYQMALIFFEILYPMKTQMERFKVLDEFKLGIFPTDFHNEFKEKLTEMLGEKIKFLN